MSSADGYGLVLDEERPSDKQQVVGDVQETGVEDYFLVGARGAELEHVER
ncbi:MAG: hypothetical protein R2864_01155 [Syntrophotaleaceae bacterium]